MKNLLASIAVLPLFFCGCASTIVWNATGKEYYSIENIRTNISEDAVEVSYCGKFKRSIIPWTGGWDCGNFNRTISFSRKNYERDSFNDIIYEVKRDPQIRRVFMNKHGIASLHTTQYMIHPDDIKYLSSPVIIPHYNGKENYLFIPLKIARRDSYVVIRGYYAFDDNGTKSDIYPDSKKFTSDMDGAWITAWKCCLMPLPLAWDIATFPLQFITLLLL